MRKLGSVFIALVISLIVGARATAQETASRPSPSPEHKRLAAFVGKWKEEILSITVEESCEWFPGEFTVVCHNQLGAVEGKTAPITKADVANLKGLQIMTYDADAKAYKDYEFDSYGNNTFATGTFEGDTFTWLGENKYGGKMVKTRVAMKIVSPDLITTRTEVLNEDGSWKMLSESKRNRVK